MKNIKNTIFITVLIFLSSCSLETGLYGDLPADLFPENSGQLESIKLSAYGEQVHLLDDWNWWLYAQEVSSDVLVFPQRGTDWEDGGKWRVLNRHNWNSQTAAVESMWNGLYTGVTRCNQAIEFLSSDTEAAEMARAELRVLRSFYYYLLIDNYGAVPYIETFTDAETNPYRINREDVYYRLVDIVNEALPLLPDASSIGSSWVSKEMAYMLLGKLYLNAGVYTSTNSFDAEDMDSVVANMDRIIDGGSFMFENNRLAPFNFNNSNSPENIYTILNDENASDGMRHNFRTLHTLHQQTFDLQSTPWNGCAVKPDFYERLFAPNDGFDDADDLTSVNNEIVDQRSLAFLHGQQYDINGEILSNDNGDFILIRDIPSDIMNDGSDGGATTRFSGYRIVKYEVEEGGGPIMNNDFPVFRLSDAYLMRAEAGLRNPGSNNPDADLNMIRELAGLPSVTATLEEVLNERGRELFMEGHRRSDLIRFGEFADRDWWLGASESGAGTERVLFPLPYSQTQANPNLSAEPISLNL